MGAATENYRLSGSDLVQDLTSLYDPKDKFFHKKILPQHDPNGFIDSPFKYEVRCACVDYGCFREGALRAGGPVLSEIQIRNSYSPVEIDIRTWLYNVEGHNIPRLDNSDTAQFIRKIVPKISQTCSGGPIRIILLFSGCLRRK